MQKVYKTYDVAARTASLALFAILIGLAIQFGIELIIHPKATYSTYFNFATFLITASRFYHGITIYHEKPRKESPAQFMINFYFHIIILICFCIIARYIDDNKKFIYALLALSLIDVVWALLSACLKKFKNSDIFIVWLYLNLITAIFLMLILISRYAKHENLSLFICVFYIAMAIFDYSLCRNYYFYEDSGKKSHSKR